MDLIYYQQENKSEKVDQKKNAPKARINNNDLFNPHHRSPPSSSFSFS